ncbi:MAG: 30S ribosomal protein S7 [Blastocatellia bacterium]
MLYSALDAVKAKTSEEPLKIFKKAVENLQPRVEVKSKRVGGANYQVPVEVSSSRRTALAMRWLISYARDRGEKTMVDRLAAEILDASGGKGSSYKKKEDVHRMAEANKAFAHYRW